GARRAPGADGGAQHAGSARALRRRAVLLEHALRRRDPLCGLCRSARADRNRREPACPRLYCTLPYEWARGGGGHDRAGSRQPPRRDGNGACQPPTRRALILAGRTRRPSPASPDVRHIQRLTFPGCAPGRLRLPFGHVPYWYEPRLTETPMSTRLPIQQRRTIRVPRFARPAGVLLIVAAAMLPLAAHAQTPAPVTLFRGVRVFDGTRTLDSRDV